MEDIKKALEISGLKEKPDDEERYYNPFACRIYDACIKIAEWKEQQMIEKAIKCVKNLLQEGVDPNFVKRFKEEIKK